MLRLSYVEVCKVGEEPIRSILLRVWIHRCKKGRNSFIRVIVNLGQFYNGCRKAGTQSTRLPVRRAKSVLKRQDET